MSAATDPVDWTQVLVVAVPILVAQMATVVIAALNHRKASAAEAKVEASTARVNETAEKVDAIHGRTKMSNGVTLGEAVEATAREVKAINKELGEMRRAQGVFATTLGVHLADHDSDNRRDP